MRNRVRRTIRSGPTPRRRQTPRTHLEAWARRIPLVHAALRGVTTGPPVGVASHRDLAEALEGVIDAQDRSHVWLTLAVLTGRFPDRTTVVEVARSCEFDKGDSLWQAVADLTTDESAAWQVRMATHEVLVDVAHTASTVLTTGIQRVARETTRRWLRDHDCTPVSWSRDFQSLRELTAFEQMRIVTNAARTNS